MPLQKIPIKWKGLTQRTRLGRLWLTCVNVAIGQVNMWALSGVLSSLVTLPCLGSLLLLVALIPFSDIYFCVCKLWITANPVWIICYSKMHAGVSVVDGKIYILGGEDGWDHFHDTIECYSPETNSWTHVGEMLTGRSWLSCAPLRVSQIKLDTVILLDSIIFITSVSLIFKSVNTSMYT